MRSEVALKGSFKTAQVNDERFTRVGRWLRRTRLDEIPQLYNILRGDMDFIGPRPFALEEEESWRSEFLTTRSVGCHSRSDRMGPGPTGLLRVDRRQYGKTRARLVLYPESIGRT